MLRCLVNRIGSPVATETVPGSAVTGLSAEGETSNKVCMMRLWEVLGRKTQNCGGGRRGGQEADLAPAIR